MSSRSGSCRGSYQSKSKITQPTLEFAEKLIPKGPLKANAHATTGWVWPPDAEAPFQWTLVLRNTPGEAAIKYALTNAQIGSLTLERMIFMQAQRYWIERCFQDAKNESKSDEVKWG